MLQRHVPATKRCVINTEATCIRVVVVTLSLLHVPATRPCCNFPFGKQAMPFGRDVKQFSLLNFSFANEEKLLNLGLVQLVGLQGTRRGDM